MPFYFSLSALPTLPFNEARALGCVPGSSVCTPSRRRRPHRAAMAGCAYIPFGSLLPRCRFPPLGRSLALVRIASPAPSLPFPIHHSSDDGDNGWIRCMSVPIASGSWERTQHSFRAVVAGADPRRDPPLHRRASPASSTTTRWWAVGGGGGGGPPPSPRPLGARG